MLEQKDLKALDEDITKRFLQLDGVDGKELRRLVRDKVLESLLRRKVENAHKIAAEMKDTTVGTYIGKLPGYTKRKAQIQNERRLEVCCLFTNFFFSRAHCSHSRLPMTL